MSGGDSTILVRRLRRAIREAQECMPVALDPIARQHVLRAADELTAAEKRALELIGEGSEERNRSSRRFP